jgi:hypothetical protein
MITISPGISDDRSVNRRGDENIFSPLAIHTLSRGDRVIQRDCKETFNVKEEEIRSIDWTRVLNDPGPGTVAKDLREAGNNAHVVIQHVERMHGGAKAEVKIPHAKKPEPLTEQVIDEVKNSEAVQAALSNRADGFADLLYPHNEIVEIKPAGGEKRAHLEAQWYALRATQLCGLGTFIPGTGGKRDQRLEQNSWPGHDLMLKYDSDQKGALTYAYRFEERPRSVRLKSLLIDFDVLDSALDAVKDNERLDERLGERLDDARKFVKVVITAASQLGFDEIEDELNELESKVDNLLILPGQDLEGQIMIAKRALKMLRQRLISPPRRAVTSLFL